MAKTGIGTRRKYASAEEEPNQLAFTSDHIQWDRWVQHREGRHADRVNLLPLKAFGAPGAMIYKAYWDLFGNARKQSQTAHALRRWCAFCEATTCAILPSPSEAMLSIPRFSAELARAQLTRRSIIGIMSRVTAILAQANRLCSDSHGTEWDKCQAAIQTMSLPRVAHTPLSDPGLSEEAFEAIVKTAGRDIEVVISRNQAIGLPPTALELVPFIIQVGVLTGCNPSCLLQLSRRCWCPEAILEGHYRVTWFKPRANADQSLVFPGKSKDRIGLIEILEFVKKWTDHLVDRVAKRSSDDLWLYSNDHALDGLEGPNDPGDQSRIADSRIQSMGSLRTIAIHLRQWCKERSIAPFRIGQLRSGAATTILRASGNITHVQTFLGHKNISTTILYIRQHALRPLFNSVITATQKRIVGLVIPTPRNGIGISGSSAAAETAITDGEHDVGTCTCRNPFASPMPGEIAGRRCRSFNACYFCPNAIWFKEHLPLEMWKLRRFEALQGTDPQWSSKYATVCEIIRRDILGSFSAADITEAASIAEKWANHPVLVAPGVTV